jgi:hypothetical protein
MDSSPGANKTQSIIFYAGLIIHMVINLFVAALSEVHSDEAYYWMYAQYPQWGYFDHPPMIAWFIMIGQNILGGNLGLRLLTVLSNGLALVFIWRMVKHYRFDALLFWSIVYSVLLIHPYGFVATPDAPLFFFAALYFYILRKYFQNEKFAQIIGLAFSLALMGYSKYHGFLILGFTVLAYPKLLLKGSAWVIAIIALIYFLPHVLWQLDNDFPSLRYHLVDSHQTPYRFSVTLDYLANQVLLTGPWLGWFFLFVLFKSKPNDRWERVLKVSGIGIFVFFLVATLGGDFEAHWTLIAFIPLIILAYRYVAENLRWRKWVIWSGGINLLLITAVKFLLVSPLAPELPGLKTIAGWRKSDIELKAMTGNRPVVFQDTWNRAARFAYNTNDRKVAHLNSAFYRQNQFSMWGLDDELTGKSVYVVSTDREQFLSCDSLVTSKATWYGKVFDDFRSYYNLQFDTSGVVFGDTLFTAGINLVNSCDRPVSFGEGAVTPAWFQIYYEANGKWKLLASSTVNKVEIPENKTIEYPLAIPLTQRPDPREDYFLVLKVGELKPIPMKYHIEHQAQ